MVLSNWVFLLFFGLFVAAMFLSGIWGAKKTSTLGDFFLGGRNVGPWISAFAYGTTYFSAVIFIGFAGKLGWNFGIKVLWIGIGNALVGSFFAWIVLGKRTRQMTHNLKVLTMPEFLQDRFDGKYIKMMASSLIFIFLLPYSASVFKGLGHLFEVYFNIPYNMVLLTIVLITGVYLVLGGYFAITLTSFIQGILMIIGVIALVLVLIVKSGQGIDVISSISQAYDHNIPVSSQPSNLLLWCIVFMTSFGVWGLPQMVQKFYAVKNVQVIKKAAIVTGVFALIIGVSAYFIGAMTHLFYQSPPIVDGKVLFDQIIPNLFVQYVPSGLMILILLLMLSASMSTLASVVLVSASSVAIDMYKGHINPNVSKEKSLFMMRFLSAIFILLSYFIARFKFAFIVTLMSLSWGVISGAFMAAYVYGLYWKRTTKWAVKAGMTIGAFLCIILFFVWGPSNSPIAATIAIIVPFFVIPIVSMFTKAPKKAILKKAFEGIN